jgi:mono/diheme cytochrome c family protein
MPNPSAVAGAALFAENRCTSCHTVTSLARRRQSVEFYERYLADPTRFGNRVMPRYARLGPERLHDLAVFLAASKDPR